MEFIQVPSPRVRNMLSVRTRSQLSSSRPALCGFPPHSQGSQPESHTVARSNGPQCRRLLQRNTRPGLSQRAPNSNQPWQGQGYTNGTIHVFRWWMISIQVIGPRPLSNSCLVDGKHACLSFSFSTDLLALPASWPVCAVVRAGHTPCCDMCACPGDL